MDELLGFAFSLVLFGTAYFFGTRTEKRHFAQIVEREKALVSLPAVTFESLDDQPVARTKLVMGNVVIAGDFFKQVVASFASIFGLRISVAESLVDRARREAILRMKDQAQGANIILNVRVESTKIGERKEINGLEIIAYGTAVYYQK